MLLSFTVDTLILLLHCWQRKQNKEVVVEEDVADESIEEESDDVDENEEYDADADEESKRQQGLVVEV